MKINYNLIFITSAAITASALILNSSNDNSENKITGFIKKIRQIFTSACKTNQKNPKPQILYIDESPAIRFDTDSNPVNSKTVFSYPIQLQRKSIVPIALIGELEVPENLIS